MKILKFVFACRIRNSEDTKVYVFLQVESETTKIPKFVSEAMKILKFVCFLQMESEIMKILKFMCFCRRNQKQRRY